MSASLRLLAGLLLLPAAVTAQSDPRRPGACRRGGPARLPEAAGWRHRGDARAAPSAGLPVPLLDGEPGELDGQPRDRDPRLAAARCGELSPASGLRGPRPRHRPRPPARDP